MYLTSLKNRRTSYVSANILLYFILSLFCFLVFTFKCSALSIIVNPQVVRGTVSRNSLQAIFGMRFHTWPDGIPIKVFVLPDNHPLHKKFCKDELNIFPHQLRWCWDRQVFSGTGQAPIEVSTPKEMLEKVASTPGAIGYSEWPPVDETLKILLIK